MKSYVIIFALLTGCVTPPGAAEVGELRLELKTLRHEFEKLRAEMALDKSTPSDDRD